MGSAKVGHTSMQWYTTTTSAATPRSPSRDGRRPVVVPLAALLAPMVTPVPAEAPWRVQDDAVLRHTGAPGPRHRVSHVSPADARGPPPVGHGPLPGRRCHVDRTGVVLPDRRPRPVDTGTRPRRRMETR